jgi:hypothetical protein
VCLDMTNRQNVSCVLEEVQEDLTEAETPP